MKRKFMHRPHRGRVTVQTGMKRPRRATVPRSLREIPGVGPSIAQDLADLGYLRPEDLRGADPERMYRRICSMRGTHQDRCLLYVFRCAVYYADNSVHDPQLLKWWNWKDRKDGGM
jgi:hypothetical protein